MTTQSIALTPETLPAIMWQNQPVITTELLADIYGTEIIRIQQNFTRNAGRFIEGVHYFLLKGLDLKAFKTNYLKDSQLKIGKRTPALYLWTERGTVRHAKILDTDNAWAVQDRLEDFYFTKNQYVPNALRDLPKDDRMTLISKRELESLRKVAPKPLAWADHATMMLSLPTDQRVRWVITNHAGTTVINPIDQDVLVGKPEHVIRELKILGYHVIKDDPQNKLETIAKIATMAKFEA